MSPVIEWDGEVREFNIFIITTPGYYAEQDLLKLSKNIKETEQLRSVLVRCYLRSTRYVHVYRDVSG